MNPYRATIDTHTGTSATITTTADRHIELRLETPQGDDATASFTDVAWTTLISRANDALRALHRPAPVMPPPLDGLNDGEDG